MSDDQVARILDGWADLVKGLDSAFNGQRTLSEAERPLAARQVRYGFALREIGRFLAMTGHRHLQRPLFELTEALFGLSEGHTHPLFEIEKKRGRRHDRPEIWRLRADLCVGIRWVMAGGKERRAAIADTVKRYKKGLAKIERSGTKDLATLIEAWLTRLETPVQSDDQAAVEFFRSGIAQLEARRSDYSQAGIRRVGESLIKETAKRASELL